MSDWPGSPRRRDDAITIPMIWVAHALSLIFHILALWVLLPHLDLTAKTVRGDPRERLNVNLAPSASPPPAASTAPQRETRTAARPAPAPPVIALDRAMPDLRPVSPVDASPRPPAENDLASFIEARRRARAESSPSPFRGRAPDVPPVEDENARSERIVAANLDSKRVASFGNDPDRGGGVFVIQQLRLDRAEFVFYGWNKDIRRSTLQPIEVRRENHSSIHIAVVRRMIEIIREKEKGDFTWESKRLGRVITRSARLEDNAELEAFLLRDFFDDPWLKR
jgi:hypothetical protein